MVLDADVVDQRPGTAIVIPPRVAHRGGGDFKAWGYCSMPSSSTSKIKTEFGGIGPPPLSP